MIRLSLTGAMLLLWLLIAIALSVLVNRVNFVQGAVVPGHVPVPEIAARISAPIYAMDLLKAAIGAIAFAAACLSTGLAMLGRRSKLGGDYFAVVATAFVIGEIVFSIVFLSSILVFRLTRYIVAVTLGLGLLLGLRRFRQLLGVRPRAAFGNFAVGDRVLIGLLAAILGGALLYSSSRLSYDGSVDYFSSAKLMAITQRPGYTFPQDLFPVSSFHTGILFASVIQLFGDQSARLVSWLNGAAILVLGSAIAKEAGLSLRARLYFLAMMLTTTAFVDLLGDGKVDLISTAPLVAAAYWVVRRRMEPTPRSFALIGTLLGFSMAARPFNAFLGFVFLVAFYGIGIIWRPLDLRLELRKLALAAAWILPPLVALGVFHAWQNWQWLGNPLAPLVAAKELNPIALPGGGAQAGARVWWQWQFNPRQLTAFRLLYPFTVSFINSPQSLGTISPLFVGFLPFLALARVRARLRARGVLIWIGMAAAITLALWIALFSAVMEIRYALLFWMLLFMVIAEVVDVPNNEDALPWMNLVAPMVSAVLAIMALRVPAISFSTYSPVDAGGRAHCYDNILCTFTEPLNQIAAPGERVFVLSAYRYYLRPDLFACASRAPEYGKFERLSQGRSPRFWLELYRAGYSYVTFETNYAVFHTHFGELPSVAGLPAWLHISNLGSSPDGLERVYSITTTSPPERPAALCVSDGDGIWQVPDASSGDPQ